MRSMLCGFLFLAATLFCSMAQATSTWSQPGTAYSLLTETTGTGDAPSAATDGLALAGITTVSVYALKSGADELHAGSLLAYLYDPVGAAWSRAPDLDLTTIAAACSFVGINFRANGGRIAYVPSGLGHGNYVRIFGWRQ